jgi:alpha-N-arabinofuranosidase
LWFAQVDATNRVIGARFKGIDPDRETVEINVRPTVFTPEKSVATTFIVAATSPVSGWTGWHEGRR